VYEPGGAATAAGQTAGAADKGLARPGPAGVSLSPMCAIAAYSKLLVWLFLAGTVCMAVLSRKLNDHLLTPPEPDRSILFRRKHFIRPSYLIKPDLYFDRAGQGLAWRVALLAALSFAVFLALLYVMLVCRPAAGG